MRRAVRTQVDAWLQDLRMIRSRGSFARNATVTLSGALIGTLSQILLTPLVTRLYGPEAYGVYGLFLAITTNVAVLATGSYPLAFILPAREDHFRELFRGTLLLLLLVVSICMLLVPFRESFYALVPGWGILGSWALLLPLAILLQGLSLIFGQACGRHKAFAVNSGFNAGFNVVVRLFNVVFGWLSNGAIHGLILGEVIVRGALLGVFMKPLRNFGIQRSIHLRNPLRALAMLRRYRRYPRYVLPTRSLGLLFGQLPLFFLAGASNPAAMGQFALATALLMIPLRLFGYSLSTVFMQKATETLRLDHAKLPSITSRLFDRLMILGVLPFATLVVFGDILFGFVLGPEWSQAGVFSSMLGPYFYVRLMAEPMVSLFAVLGRERRLFGFQLVNALLGSLALYTGLYVLEDVGQAVFLFGLIGGTMYAYLGARILHRSGAAWARQYVKATLLFTLACIMAMLVRNVLFDSYLISYW